MKHGKNDRRDDEMRFLGNKESISNRIRQLLQNQRLLDRSLVFFDAFCGSGSVSDALKDSFYLIVNDIMNWSVLFTIGRIKSCDCDFGVLGFDPFQYLNGNTKKRCGFFYKNYSPGSSNRMYFTKENAGRIDYFRWQIEDWRHKSLINEDEYAVLIASLIESVSSVSNTAGVYGAFLKKWDVRALKPIIFQKVGAQTLQSMGVEGNCGKIEDSIDKVSCDILYIDPPYTQNQYGTQYHLLETLVLSDEPKISPVTGSRSTAPYRSDWSKEYKAHILLDKIVAKTQARYVLMSYSNDGILSKDYIEAVLKRYGKPETLLCEKIEYKQYLNWKANEDEKHFEYLFFVEKKPVTEIVYEAPLNYVGSKAKMVSDIRANLPGNIDTLMDVFGGGFNAGANIPAKHVFYNDLNFFVMRLIQSFRNTDTYEYLMAIRKNIQKFGLTPGNQEAYCAARKHYNSRPMAKRDIKLLYTLILYGFQQQIRFNSNHDFNNPPGNRWFNDCVLAKFISFARHLKEQYCTFMQDDFTQTLGVLKSGDFAYLDPPYMLTCGSYNDGKRGFGGWTRAHESALFSYMDALDAKGVMFLFSYVEGSGKGENKNLAQWLSQCHYKVVHVDSAQGRYGRRKEILVKNYE